MNDIQKLKIAGLDKKAKALIELLKENPYQSPPPFEKLTGDLKGAYSRRINIQHRLVYEILEVEIEEEEKAEKKKEKIVKIIKLWTHYE